MPKPRTPQGLEPASRRWFRKLADEYGITDQGGLLLLETAMRAHSQMTKCQETIDAEGLTITDRWDQVKQHPLVPALRDARAQLLAALKSLNMDLEPLREGPGRPGGK